MNISELFLYVVPKSYFLIPGFDEPPSLERYGFVEPIGPDLYSMLIHVSNNVIRNVHEEDLHKIGLTFDAAKAKAIDNLRAIVKRQEDIQLQLSMGEDGLGHIVWMGHWLTASCIVLPELYQWNSKYLKTNELLVSVPQQQFMFLFSVGDAEFRQHMRSYIMEVVADMEKRITFDWFLLTERGLEPYTDKPEADQLD